METKLAEFVRDTPAGREAEKILRACVHCGFCTATCPTYQITGDELDGPRGRIYLIKGFLEGKAVTETTRRHLDRCLSCRSCETTCPSGVTYHRLLDIGRDLMNEHAPRPLPGRMLTAAVRESVRNRFVFGTLLALGKIARTLLPVPFAGKIPDQYPVAPWPKSRHPRRYLTLRGCVQETLAPSINLAAAKVLDRAGVALMMAPKDGCCGALRLHGDDRRGGLNDLRALIDRWWPFVAEGQVEGIAISASGCGAHLREAGQLLADDPDYAEKAATIAGQVRDLSEVIADHVELLRERLSPPAEPTPIAFHSPCTLQHGLGVRGVAESLLVAAGYRLVPVEESHLCCGSAGIYALLHPLMSGRLRERKLEALCVSKPRFIATANIGCLTQLSGGEVPVRHWIELLADRLP
ncbi:MAG TPA: glycolate oxidase subunit GlcF [Rhodocyclaceae bacterium]